MVIMSERIIVNKSGNKNESRAMEITSERIILNQSDENIVIMINTS
jgi:hypothetical protein